jgi:hypothetical protein
MRRSAHFAVITVAAALAGCGFTPKAEMTGTATGAANSSGHITGTGNSTGTGASSGGGGSPGGSSNLDNNCGAVSHGATMQPPDILIVQDKSGSMNQLADGTSCGNMCATTGKWAQMTTALKAVTAMTDTTVNWGLKFFATSNSGCTVNNGAEVPVAPKTAAAIATAINGATPGSSTPTTAAMNAAVTYMKTLTDTNPKYILLATDGLPNCAAGGGTNTDDSPAAIASVMAAATAGFPTFVVGIGSTMADATLTSMANAGGVPQMGGATAFYQVNDTAQLETALGSIIGVASSCVFNIGTAPNNMTSVNSINVYGNDGTNNIAIPHDASNGYEYSNADHTQITLYGTACDAVTSGAYKSVSVTFICIVT